MIPSIPALPTLVEAARSWHGPVQAPAGFEVGPGEVVLFAGEGVELIELRDSVPPLVGGSSAFEYAVAAELSELTTLGRRLTRTIWLQESVPARDVGSLVITDRRVVLTGARRREWPLDRVIDVTHDDGTPETWLTSSHRKRVSGFRYTGGAAVQVRFCLALAMAQARGQRPMLVAALSAQAERLARSSAGVPVVTPVGSPPPTASGLRVLASRAVLGRPGSALPRKVARGAATALVGLVLLGMALPDAPGGSASTLAAEQAQLDQRGDRAAAEDRAREVAAQLASEQAAADRAAADRAASDRAAADRAASDRAAADRAAAVQAATVRVAADKAAADRAASDRAAQAASQKAASQKAAADRAAADAARDAQAPQTLAAPPSGGDCHASYPDFCIPASGGDVDCGELTQKDFTALEPDPYGLDGNNDGVACES